MQRTDSFGRVVALPAPEAQVNSPGYFTQGDPSTSIPATIVPAWWLNIVQESIMEPILAAGLTPSKTTPLLMQALGVIGQNVQGTTFALANNQVAAANVTGVLLDSATVRSAIIEMSIYRKDLAQERVMRVKLDCFYKPVAGTWELIISEAVGETLDDMGVDFFITSAGQVQYKSSNFAGGSYVGELRYKINRFKV